MVSAAELHRIRNVCTSSDSKLMIATEPDWIRSAIEKHREWIESVLGVTIGKMVVIRVENNFTGFAARQIFRDVRLTKLQGPPCNLREEVTSIEYPDGMPILMSARMLSKPNVTDGATQAEWEVNCQDTPVAIRFKTLRGAIVALELAHHEQDSTGWTEVVICRQDKLLFPED